MSDIVPAEDIERIVGVQRHATQHWARAVSTEQTVYILHSQRCVDTTPDLRDCAFSVHLDRGIDISEWTEDVPVRVIPYRGRLRPTDSL